MKTDNKSYLLIGLVLSFSEEANVFDQSGLNVLVIHELAEDVKLLAQELVGEIHCCVHNASAVGSDGVGDVSNVDCVEMLVVTCFLNKDLFMKNSSADNIIYESKPIQ